MKIKTCFSQKLKFSFLVVFKLGKLFQSSFNGKQTLLMENKRTQVYINGLGHMTNPYQKFSSEPKV